MVMSETPAGETWLSKNGLEAVETGVVGGLGDPKTQLGRTSQSSERERVSLEDISVAAGRVCEYEQMEIKRAQIRRQKLVD